MTVLQEGLQRCPAHEDGSPSLSVHRGANGKWLLHCHAGCPTERILTALGLTWGDLFPDGPTKGVSRQNDARKDKAENLLEAARLGVLRQACRQLRRLEPFLPFYAASDFLRRSLRAVADVRRLSTILGPSPFIWDALENAAGVERLALWVEAELDAILGTGRIA